MKSTGIVILLLFCFTTLSLSQPIFLSGALLAPSFGGFHGYPRYGGGFYGRPQYGGGFYGYPHYGGGFYSPYYGNPYRRYGYGYGGFRGYGGYGQGYRFRPISPIAVVAG